MVTTICIRIITTLKNGTWPVTINDDIATFMDPDTWKEMKKTMKAYRKGLRKLSHKCYVHVLNMILQRRNVTTRPVTFEDIKSYIELHLQEFTYEELFNVDNMDMNIIGIDAYLGQYGMGLDFLDFDQGDLTKEYYHEHIQVTSFICFHQMIFI